MLTNTHNNEVNMSDQGFSEGILYGGNPATLVTAIDQRTLPVTFTFQSAGKPVLTITPEGELIFENVTEAAQALLAEWNRLTGRY